MDEGVDLGGWVPMNRRERLNIFDGRILRRVQSMMMNSTESECRAWFVSRQGQRPRSPIRKWSRTEMHPLSPDHVLRSVCLSPEQRDLATNVYPIIPTHRFPYSLPPCPPRKFPGAPEKPQDNSRIDSFTPSSAIDQEKERDWAANLGMFPLLRPENCSQYNGNSRRYARLG